MEEYQKLSNVDSTRYRKWVIPSVAVASTTDTILGGIKMRTIKIYEKCEDCKGTGLDLNTAPFRRVDCLRCQGYGENLAVVTKEDNYEREIARLDERAPGR